MELQCSSESIAQGDSMGIQQDAQDYYYNETNQLGCWGYGATTADGFYDPSNYYMVNNARCIKYDLEQKGWSYNAIMAVLGNMCYESNLNPAQSEYQKPMNGEYGYGLAQWTPRRTTIIPYLNRNNHPITSGYYQLDYLDLGTNWIAKPAYNNMTWQQFKTSSLSVDYLTNAFLACYERGKANHYRNDCALYYELFFSGVTIGNQIMVTSTGNGSAYAVPSLVNDGDPFTLYALPETSETLDDITAVASNGQYIAMAVQQQYTYNYDQTNWGNYIHIMVEFSGETPPVPPEPTPTIKRKIGMPIWEYPALKNRRYT